MLAGFRHQVGELGPDGTQVVGVLLLGFQVVDQFAHRADGQVPIADPPVLASGRLTSRDGHPVRAAEGARAVVGDAGHQVEGRPVVSAHTGPAGDAELDA